jgi:hypothetical protein
MESALPAVNVVELNPHAPRPFVFTEIALCLRDSIRAAGYPSSLYINFTDSAAVSLVLGALPPLLGPLEQLDPARTVIVNFEQLASGSSIASAEYKQWLANWVVADYHCENIGYLKAANGERQRALELPIVPGPSLVHRPDPPIDKSVDVLFYGTPSERRSEIIRRLQAAGLTVETIAGAYAQELAPAIQRARIVLHVHFYETGLFPIARLLAPIANEVAVVCEDSVFSPRSDWSGSGIVFAAYDEIVPACLKLLESDESRRVCAQRARQFAGQMDFKTPLEQILQALEGFHRQQPASVEHEGGEAGLSNEAIEAILHREATALPPESHLPAPPVPLVERQLGEGKYGNWALALVVLFSLYMLWQTLRF